MANTDRIEKEILLRAPIARVWRALSSSEEFSRWLGAKLDGSFVAGATVRGNVTIPQYEHVKLEMKIDRIEPQTFISYHWHPAPLDKNTDYSKEPTTLVEFRLKEVQEGTLLTVTESGFNQLTEARREVAFRSNSGGWEGQLKNIERHVSGS